MFHEFTQSKDEQNDCSCASEAMLEGADLRTYEHVKTKLGMLPGRKVSKQLNGLLGSRSPRCNSQRRTGERTHAAQDWHWQG